MRSTPMSVDVTQIKHYSRLIPRYSNYYYYSIKLTFVLGIRMGDYSLSLPPSLSLSLQSASCWYLLYPFDFMVNRGLEWG
jgi:hypothetical protein